VANLINQNFGAVEQVFVNNGFTDEQAEGITAGLAAESQLDPSRQETLANGLPGPGLGLAQFTSPSQQAAFASIGGVNSSATDQAQLVADELNGVDTINPETNAGNAIMNQTTSSGALSAFSRLFERPKDGGAGDISRGLQILSGNPGGAASTTATQSGITNNSDIFDDPDNNLGNAAGTPDFEDLPDDTFDGAGATGSTLAASGTSAASGATAATGSTGSTAATGAGGTPVNITDLPAADTAIKGAGSNVQSGLGNVSTGVTGAANAVAGTAASTINSLESYTSNAFVVVALAVMGIIFIAFGLGLFGKRSGLTDAVQSVLPSPARLKAAL
jgi:Phage tail lysozyme